MGNVTRSGSFDSSEQLELSQAFIGSNSFDSSEQLELSQAFIGSNSFDSQSSSFINHLSVLHSISATEPPPKKISSNSLKNCIKSVIPSAARLLCVQLLNGLKTLIVQPICHLFKSLTSTPENIVSQQNIVPVKTEIKKENSNISANELEIFQKNIKEVLAGFKSLKKDVNYIKNLLPAISHEQISFLLSEIKFFIDEVDLLVYADQLPEEYGYLFFTKCQKLTSDVHSFSDLASTPSLDNFIKDANDLSVLQTNFNLPPGKLKKIRQAGRSSTLLNQQLKATGNAIGGHGSLNVSRPRLIMPDHVSLRTWRLEGQSLRDNDGVLIEAGQSILLREKKNIIETVFSKGETVANFDIFPADEEINVFDDSIQVKKKTPLSVILKEISNFIECGGHNVKLDDKIFVKTKGLERILRKHIQQNKIFKIEFAACQSYNLSSYGGSKSEKGISVRLGLLEKHILSARMNYNDKIPQEIIQFLTQFADKILNDIAEDKANNIQTNLVTDAGSFIGDGFILEQAAQNYKSIVNDLSATAE